MISSDEENKAQFSRTDCKYGIKCYQKNPEHIKKYKHPLKKRKVSKDTVEENFDKKTKLISEEEPSTTVTISNDVSETEDESSNTSNKFLSNTTVEESNSENDPITSTFFDVKEFIKEKFLVDMPEDFYTFWEFCKSLNPTNPNEAFSDAGLTLVGPYDVLSGKLINNNEKPAEEYLIHWRYYFDPPEFQTVVKGRDSAGYHIGYFRDNPKDPPVFLACNNANKTGEFTCMGENIYAAVSQYLTDFKKSCNPFKQSSIIKLHSSLKKEAEKLNMDLTTKTKKIEERDKKIVVRTFNKLGLVVPYNRKTQLGYRHLMVSNSKLKKLLDQIANASQQQKEKVISELQPVLTATNIATDECDFGTGIELGWDILAHGVESLNITIAQFLSTGYRLLEKEEFAKIIAAHMKRRRKGADLSILTVLYEK